MGACVSESVLIRLWGRVRYICMCMCIACVCNEGITCSGHVLIVSDQFSTGTRGRGILESHVGGHVGRGLGTVQKVRI